MSTVNVIVELPFFLRLEGTIEVFYQDLCPPPRIEEIGNQRITIEFKRVISPDFPDRLKQ